MLRFRRFAPLVLCLGVLAGCAYGPLPPQPSARTGWNSRAMTASPQVAQKPIVPPNPWKPNADAPPREWRHIVIHHTASSGGTVEAIHESHLGRGWDGIGYHFVIGNGSGMADGEVTPAGRWREQMHGAHAGKNEYNQHGIGICLVGNFDESHPSAAQLASVKRLVATLKHEYKVPSSNVIAHRDVKATACPGKNFPLAEVGSSRLVPTFAGAGQSTFRVVSDPHILNPVVQTVHNEATQRPLAPDHIVSHDHLTHSAFRIDTAFKIDTAEGRPVR